MVKFRAQITDPQTENSESDSDEERLDPGSYQWTRNLLSGENSCNPTRYELFDARKKFEAYVIRTRKLRKLRLKSERLGKMLSALEDCVEKFANIKNEENSEELNVEKSVNYKRVTRSVSCKFEKLNVELKEIGNGVHEKLVEFKGLTKLKNLSDEIVRNFLSHLSCINCRILEYRELRIELLKYLER